MSRVALYLVGPPHLERDGVAVKLRRRKALALLAYLAAKPGAHSRDALAELLYGRHGRDRARADLRPLLSLVAATLGPGLFAADRHSVTVRPGRGLWIDVARYRRLLKEARAADARRQPAETARKLATAVGLYRGEFLSGFFLPDCPDFESWQLEEQERLRHDQSWALESIANLQAEEGRYDEAIACARDRLALDPLEEDAHEQLMLLLDRAGRRAEALEQYGTCAAVLEREIGERPGEKLERLRALIASRAPSAAPQARPSVCSVDRVASSGEPAVRAGRGLVGREAECARLAACLDDAMRGVGRIVLISGEAGVGKSRLVHELKDRALRAASGGAAPLWLEGAGLELGAPVAYWPFIDMLGRHFGSVSAAVPVRAEAPFAPACAEHGGGGPGLARQVADLLEGLRSRGRITEQRKEELGPLLGKLLSVRFGNHWDQKLGRAHPEQIKFQMFLAIRDLLLALAEGAPLVLVLEDLQWADALSLQLIPSLMEGLTAAPLLIVCVYRPEKDHPCSRLGDVAARRCPERFVEIALRELGPLESELLIASMLNGQALPPDVVDSVVEQAGGNPFFVGEIVRSLIDAGALYRDGGRWRARADFRTVELPATVQGIIQARVERLDGELRHLLESASVMGRIFRRRMLELAAEKQEAVNEALSELAGRALIHADAAAPAEHFAFPHDLTRQAVYQGILERRRALLHLRTAEAMEALYHESLQEYCEQLAYHYEMAGDASKAVDYLLTAGERAADAYMNEEAIRHFERALSLLESSGDARFERRLRALTQVGKVYEAAGLHSQAERRLREAAELGGRIGLPGRDRARVLYLLCKTLSSGHNPSAYLSVAREGLALLAAEPDAVEALYLQMVLAYGFFDAGDFAELHAQADRLGNAIRRQPYSFDIADMGGFLTLVWLIHKDEARALETLDWLEREAREHNDLMNVAATCLRRGRDVHARRGDLAGAVRMIEQGAAEYRGLGARYLEARAELSLGDVYYRFGRVIEAGQHLQRATAIRSDIGGHPHLSVESELLQGQISLCRGEVEAALEAFRSALLLRPGAQWGRYLRMLVGRCLILLGQKQAARDCFRELLAEKLALHLPPSYFLTANPAMLLGFLEDCCEGEEEYRRSCRELVAAGARLEQAFARSLEGPEPAPTRRRLADREDFRGPVAPEWVWQGELQDGSVAGGDGLVVHAATGRGLRDMNFTAPRLVRPVSGDLAARVICSPAQGDTPAAGGLLLWKDARSYLRLDRGSAGSCDALFSGCVGGNDAVFGRLRMRAGRAHLRIERSGASVHALCSEDGQAWRDIARAEFRVDDPLHVGIFADGAVPPELYPVSFTQGSAVRFERFELWL